MVKKCMVTEVRGFVQVEKKFRRRSWVETR